MSLTAHRRKYVPMAFPGGSGAKEKKHYFSIVKDYLFQWKRGWWVQKLELGKACFYHNSSQV